jgi:hypothetical protein
VDRLFGEMRIAQDSQAGRRQFQILMEKRRDEENGLQWKSLRRSWCLGDEQFRQELLEQMSQHLLTFA